MAQEKPMVTLLTGPNRGLGRQLLESYLQRPQHVIIAGVRDPGALISQELERLPKADGTRLIVAKYDALTENAGIDLVKTLEGQEITYLDCVIANAGIGDAAPPLLNAKKADLQRLFDVNLFGTLALFQATEPMLKKSVDPKFIAMSSGLASMGIMESSPGPWYCYGVTKAALNYTIRKMHFEHEWLTAVAINPGWMKTDMGEYAAKAIGMDMSIVPVELSDATKGSLNVIDAARRDKYSGQFVSHQEQIVPW